MESLKLVAAREGLPNQSLVASILHKYTQGQLVDINEIKKSAVFNLLLGVAQAFGSLHNILLGDTEFDFALYHT